MLLCMSDRVGIIRKSKNFCPVVSQQFDSVERVCGMERGISVSELVKFAALQL
jgi:hypothetical protein